MKHINATNVVVAILLAVFVAFIGFNEEITAYTENQAKIEKEERKLAFKAYCEEDGVYKSGLATCNRWIQKKLTAEDKVMGERKIAAYKAAAVGTLRDGQGNLVHGPGVSGWPGNTADGKFCYTESHEKFLIDMCRTINGDTEKVAVKK